MTGDVFRTLAATDFSPSSLAALDFALVLARAESAPALHVVHAIALPTLPMPSGEALFAADFEQRARTELDKALHEIVSTRRGSVPIETHLVVGAPEYALQILLTRQVIQRVEFTSNQIHRFRQLEAPHVGLHNSNGQWRKRVLIRT